MGEGREVVAGQVVGVHPGAGRYRRGRRPDRHAAAGDPLPRRDVPDGHLVAQRDGLADHDGRAGGRPVRARFEVAHGDEHVVALGEQEQVVRRCVHPAPPSLTSTTALTTPLRRCREARQLVDDAGERRAVVDPAGGVDRAVFDGGDDLHPVGAGGVARRAQVQLAGVEAPGCRSAAPPWCARRGRACPRTRRGRTPPPSNPGCRVASKTTVGRSPRPRSRRTCGKCSSTTSASRPDAAAKATRSADDVGDQQPFDTGLRRQRHGQADRSGAEHQHAVVDSGLAPRHGVPADAEGLDEHELVERQPRPREQLGGGQHHALPQPAVGRHTQHLDAFAAVATAASARRAGAARQVRQHGAQLTRCDAGHPRVRPRAPRTASSWPRTRG